jgi:hypothetical protein
MPLSDTSLPYGIRDIKVARLKADGTPDVLIDLPNAQTMSFSEAEDFEELRGDDKVVARRGKGPNIEFELDAGGINLAAAVVMNGGAVVETGTTGSMVRTYRKKDTDSKPYFYAVGQSISDSGGDFHTVMYRLIADGGFEGSQEDGSFWVTKVSGTGLGSLQTGATKGALYDFVQNEVVTDISVTA